MTIMRCNDIRKSFLTRHGTVKAVDGVSLSIEKGETYGLVGESGSGKTTLGKIILGILKPDSGSLKVGTKAIQVIFQDPYNSLDPKSCRYFIRRAYSSRVVIARAKPEAI